MRGCRKTDERPFNSKFLLEGVHKVTVADNEYLIQRKLLLNQNSNNKSTASS